MSVKARKQLRHVQDHVASRESRQAWQHQQPSAGQDGAQDGQRKARRKGQRRPRWQS